MHAVIDWLNANPYAYALLFYVATAFLSLAEEKLAAWPKTQAIVSMLTSLGLHLPMLAAAVARLFGLNPNPPPPGGSKPSGGAGVAGAALALALVAGVGASGCMDVKGAADVGALVTCILAHEQEPPLQIVGECGADSVKVVLDVLSAHRAATIREELRSMADGGPPIITCGDAGAKDGSK